jgi:GT2 family glycosyltransferase
VTAAASPPRLTVVIPTHNRATTLAGCLRALFAQRPVPFAWTIAVVDDGSDDATPAVVASIAREAPVPVSYLRQAASGPAAARNLGMRQASAAIVLFIGDDIIAEPTLVEEHGRWHERHADPAVAVLGTVTWSPALAVTPYMRWLELSGNQFDYERIRGREDVDPARFLYTANLSLKRDFIASTGEWFDERFKHALLEDIDLGRRLAARGLRLKYNPSAVAYHDHAVTLAAYARRIERSSEYWVLLERKGAERTGAAAGVAATARGRRNYPAYAWFLMRIAGEVVGNWPAWWAARYFERRRLAPTAFVHAHRYWAYRGLLKLEARKALNRLRLVPRTTRAA